MSGSVKETQHTSIGYETFLNCNCTHKFTQTRIILEMNHTPKRISKHNMNKEAYNQIYACIEGGRHRIL